MLDKFILAVANCITQYVEPTTMYKTLLVAIGITMLLVPVLGQLPLLMVISFAVIMWMVTEYLYTVTIDDEDGDEG